MCWFEYFIAPSYNKNVFYNLYQLPERGRRLMDAYYIAMQFSLPRIMHPSIEAQQEPHKDVYWCIMGDVFFLLGV